MTPIKLKLFKFNWYIYRMGNVTGIFAASEDDVNEAIGEEVYFGEILGKHSEVYGTLESTDISELTDDQDFIARAIKYGIVPSGYNPLDYIRSDDDEDYED